jgi:hypothetical protein
LKSISADKVTKSIVDDYAHDALGSEITVRQTTYRNGYKKYLNHKSYTGGEFNKKAINGKIVG